jgi:hypothetical protein
MAGLTGVLQAHFLPLALLSALLLGVSFPQLGMAAANLQIPAFTTFGIFIIQVGSGCCFNMHSTVCGVSGLQVCCGCALVVKLQAPSH